MNVYRVFILSALVGTYLIQILAECLNLRALKDEIPPGLQGLYNAEKYRASQEYTRVRTRFGFIESTFSLLLILTFWFAHGFDRLDEYIRHFGFGEIITGILYIATLFIAMEIITLPFSIYSTFVIEERFGFNRTTKRTFIADRLKGLLLSALLGIPLLAMVLWFFRFAGELAWLYCWIVSIVFVLFVQFIAPIWLMPLFNKFTPLPEGELKERLFEYCRKVRFTFRDIFVIDGSRRSSKANAFFTGFGRSKRIALFDTLVEQQTTPEVVAVLAHEIGHYKEKHILLMMLLSFLNLGVLFYILSIFISRKGLFDAFYMKHISTYAGLLFFGMLYEPISFLISIALNSFSRKHELEADRYAVRTNHDPESMASALKKLSVKNLSNLTPHPFYVWLHYSHPPLLERLHGIEANASIAAASER